MLIPYPFYVSDKGFLFYRKYHIFVIDEKYKQYEL